MVATPSLTSLAIVQLTRPTDEPLSLPDVEQLAEIVNAERDNPQFLIGLLVKISRKFAEPNVFTKVKALLALHRLAHLIEPRALTALAQSVASLREEDDQKTQTPFFCLDSVTQAASGAESVGELEAVELAASYAACVLDLLSARSGAARKPSKILKKKNKSSPSGTGPFTDEQLSQLLQSLESVDRTAKRIDTPLTEQICEVLQDDKVWVRRKLDELQQVRC